MSDTTDHTVGEEPPPESPVEEHPAEDGSPVPDTDSAQTGRPETLEPPDKVDLHGWLLVGLVVVSLLVIPLFVLYIPQAHWLIGRLGFSQRQAYIVFPMLPAVLLGLTAVWATIRAYTE